MLEHCRTCAQNAVPKSKAIELDLPPVEALVHDSVCATSNKKAMLTMQGS